MNETEYAEFTALADKMREQEREESERRWRSVSGIDAESARHTNLEAKPWVSGLIWGAAGVGKTRLALEMLLPIKRDCCFIRLPEFVKLARMSSLGESTYDDRYILAADSTHLVLDDIGLRSPSEFAYEEIYNLIDARIGKNTVITSNVSLEKIAEIYDDRIASRIAGFGPVRHLTGEDWRLK